MATRPVVPRATGEGSIGTAAKHWGAGYFDTLPNWQEYLAESTGYGIVSGCEPSISGLTVTVGAGVVHLADGTRKELSATNITLDNADPTNPRIDLVYIDSTGTVAKITGTAAASPVAPALPSDGISICNVSVTAGTTTGTLTDKRDILPRFYNTGIVNVKDYGAKGDGVHDDTAAIQAAINSVNSGAIVCPSGVYRINKIGICLKSNISLIGIGESVIINDYDDYDDLLPYSMVHTEDENTNNNVIIRNIKFSQVVSAFHEHTHIIALRNVNQIVVEDCIFYKWSSDAIYINGNNNNNSIVVQRCSFDGVNKNNRNAISVIAGSHVTIRDNVIQRCTRSDMPGAIDIEPNSGNENVHDVVIYNNVITDTGKHGIIVSVAQDRYSSYELVKNITIDNNTIHDVVDYAIHILQDNTTGSSVYNKEQQNINIINNKIKNGTILIDGVNGVTFSGNSIDPQGNVSDYPVNIGKTKYVTNLKFDNNNIVETVARNYVTINVKYIRNVDFSQNTIFLKRSSSAGEAVVFREEALFLSLKNNIIECADYPIMGSIVLPTTSTDMYNSMDISTNKLSGIISGGKARFIDGIERLDAPTDSNRYYYPGAVIYNKSAAVGSPIGWINISAGRPGTWKSLGTIQS